LRDFGIMEQGHCMPEEFTDMVVFLDSERASYITGTTIQIDGGYYPS